MALFHVHQATDRVAVIKRERVEGKNGRRVFREVGRETIFGRIQEASTEDLQAFAAAGEQGVKHLRRFYCAGFPGDNLSLVKDSGGVLWDVVGDPKRHRGSRRTRRDEVVLRRVGVENGSGA